MITTFPSLGLEINGYPAVKRYLLSYGKDRLAQTGKRLSDGRKARKKTEHQWFELQDTCAYHEDFSQERLFSRTLSTEGRFAYLDQPEIFCSNSAYLLTGIPIKFLCAILNSQLIKWFVHKTAVSWGNGVPKWLKSSIGIIPVPRPKGIIDESLLGLVNKILEAKMQDDLTEATQLEIQVDRRVYSLYDLTDSEIDAVAKI